MYSIYHFFAHLYRNRQVLAHVASLESFPWDCELFSYVGRGRFPDFAIRVNPGGDLDGGELIEVKDSKSFSVSSFNSTIPTGTKLIAELTSGKRSVIRDQMLAAGDDIDSLPEREVFYLLRGKPIGKCKICLVHGSFFETIKVEQLIQQAFGQVLDERLAEEDLDISDELRNLMVRVFSRQDSFSRVRHVDRATVKLRFRIMTEAKKEGNIFNATIYPEIENDTISLVIPCVCQENLAVRLEHLKQAVSTSELDQGKQFVIMHPFNGDYHVLSFPIRNVP
ncbi:MAG: hypothetical protein OXG85_06415 [Chloroflexi bacterium]|nr:hypothetical protein [Chloroflexota bacterium]